MLARLNRYVKASLYHHIILLVPLSIPNLHYGSLILRMHMYYSGDCQDLGSIVHKFRTDTLALNMSWACWYKGIPCWDTRQSIDATHKSIRYLVSDTHIRA